MSDLRAAIRGPHTAWPTVALGVAAIALGVGSFAAHAMSLLPLVFAAPLATVAAFVAFTPMHDAAHRSVSRHRLLNDAVGIASSVLLLGPFVAFRFVHLQHHKHTNDEALDPDHYAGRGPTWMLPLRWLSQDLHYYVCIARQWSTRPPQERVEMVVQALLMAILLVGLVASGYGATVLFVWLLPVRLAHGALAFTFDYLPHVPHDVRGAHDRYRATRIIEAPGLTWLFLQQNYHLIHHLYPGVPFYRYQRIYRIQADDLDQRGVQVTRWLTRPRPVGPQTPRTVSVDPGDSIEVA